MDFEEIYQAYFHDVYLYTRSLAIDENIAEEITQETFFKALRSMHQFDGKKDIRAWLFTIAKIHILPITIKSNAKSIRWKYQCQMMFES